MSSDVADFLVPHDSAALKGGANEATRDPLRVCPQGPLIRRRSGLGGANGVLLGRVAGDRR